MGKFMCGFNILDYSDILPDYDEYTKKDVCINYDNGIRGNID
jgi:hypothetical protein